ncbi:MAG: RpiB/LacA/LacB family sugar-phosphate isomerase [Patescibacteria group bacterium]
MKIESLKLKIYLGSDHAGFELKEKLRKYLKELKYQVNDLGNALYEEQDDYPDFIFPVARAVARDPNQCRGIILGGSGQGEAIVANRIKGVRAIVLYHYDKDIIHLSREHNDANVLSVGARFISEGDAKKAVKLWLETPFSGKERHKRRIKKIDQ